MSSFPPEVVRIVSVDPATGHESGPVYFGVAYSGDEGYAITRSCESLQELRDIVGDLNDEAALLAHVGEHYPNVGL